MYMYHFVRPISIKKLVIESNEYWKEIIFLVSYYENDPIPSTQTVHLSNLRPPSDITFFLALSEIRGI